MATYLKTPHGLEEMASHAHGLGLRARRLLILIDGRRDTAALAAMTGDAKFDESLAQLQQAVQLGNLLGDAIRGEIL